jgi:hypothetical protein
MKRVVPSMMRHRSGGRSAGRRQGGTETSITSYVVAVSEYSFALSDSDWHRKNVLFGNEAVAFGDGQPPRSVRQTNGHWRGPGQRPRNRRLSAVLLCCARTFIRGSTTWQNWSGGTTRSPTVPWRKGSFLRSPEGNSLCSRATRGRLRRKSRRYRSALCSGSSRRPAKRSWTCPSSGPWHPLDTAMTRHVLARIWHDMRVVPAHDLAIRPLTRTYPVVGTGVDPVTSRFSGARSAY